MLGKEEVLSGTERSSVVTAVELSWLCSGKATKSVQPIGRGEMHSELSTSQGYQICQPLRHSRKNLLPLAYKTSSINPLLHLRKMRSECPHILENLTKKLALWERHFMGDFETTKEISTLNRKNGFSLNRIEF